MTSAAGRAWGILGGTFDPIHYAHLAIAEQTREELRLAGVLFVPAGMPPHKPGSSISPATDRAAMVVLAVADNPAFEVSRLELERAGPSYTVETIERLRAEPPGPIGADCELVFIVSAEALAGLRAWREPERVLELCRLAVVPRRGYHSPGRAWVAEHFPGREDRVIFLEGPDLGHSASDIRRRASSGRSIRYLVPPAVEQYVHDHQLYPAER